jgi:hypothetical protein
MSPARRPTAMSHVACRRALFIIGMATPAQPPDKCNTSIGRRGFAIVNATFFVTLDDF